MSELWLCTATPRGKKTGKRGKALSANTRNRDVHSSTTWRNPFSKTPHIPMLWSPIGGLSQTVCAYVSTNADAAEAAATAFDWWRHRRAHKTTQHVRSAVHAPYAPPTHDMLPHIRCFCGQLSRKQKKSTKIHVRHRLTGIIALYVRGR